MTYLKYDLHAISLFTIYKIKSYRFNVFAEIRRSCELKLYLKFSKTKTLKIFFNAPL